MVYSYGQIYEGDWVNDVWQGRGILTLNDQRYEGDFV